MPSPPVLSVIPVDGIGDVVGETNLGELLAAHLGENAGPATLHDGDVLVVTQKVVSKAEGRIETIDEHDEAAKVALVEREATRVLRRRGSLLITETHHGFICANAGIDLSNVERGTAALLPRDPDRSARRIRGEISRRLGVEIAVIISDTFGRTWREGVTDVALGSAGITPVLDLRGTFDTHGRQLNATMVCLVDEIAGAADLVMGKATGVPAAIVRGCPPDWFGEGSVAEAVIRPPDGDLFR